MSVLLASGHIDKKTGVFVLGPPLQMVSYQGRVFPCPPWGLDTERLDCQIAGKPGHCTEARPCQKHVRFASDAEEQVAKDRADFKAAQAEAKEARKAKLLKAQKEEQAR